jgi:F-type H+-transporting ATPase subunit epsilon
MATFDCQIVTPEGPAFEGEAEMIVVPGVEGELGVLARHAPLIAMLKPGQIRVRTDASNWQAFATSDGYFSVQNDRAIVLVEHAAPVDEIDTAAARALADDARERLSRADGGDEEVDRFRAERDLARAENLLGVAGR